MTYKHKDELPLVEDHYVRQSRKRNYFHSVLTLFIVLLSIFVTISFLWYFNVISFSKGKLSIYIFVGDQTDDSTHTPTESNGYKPSLKPYVKDQCSKPPEVKFDCSPDSTSQQECLSRGCCWQPVNETVLKNNKGLPPLNTPYCYYPDDFVGYSLLSYKRSQYEIETVLERKIRSGFPKDVNHVRVKINYLDESKLQIKITDANYSRYEVPVPDLSRQEVKLSPEQKYNVILDKVGNLEVIRKSTQTVIFSTRLSTLVYSDQLLQLSSLLPSNYIYGLSEHKGPLLKSTQWNRLIFFNRDQYPIEDRNSYGSHAFYLSMENDGNSHGVFLLNSNAMEIILQPTPAVTFRTTGGILDFFVLLGSTPGEVSQQYMKLVGLPAMQPYWSLGFHLCRYGYNSVNETRKVWQRTRDAGIPFDVQWNDIDYMERHNDFTYDKVNYADLPEFVNEVHEAGMHYVSMFDPGVSGSEPNGTYPPYDDGVAMDIFVKNSTGGIFQGKVWNDLSTAFPDFTNPKTIDYWTDQFRNFHSEVPFDGAWIDMNEPSNFYNGQIDGCPTNSTLEHPPYVPGGLEPLYTRTLCMTAKQYLGDHYNLHNLHGITEGIATNIALASVLKKRPFIISRSTFSGMGHYTGHWDGDILSNWDYMSWTIPSILNFNMLGMPMIGADICGFLQNTTKELCARWSALGAFYPFSRNHNDINNIDQDPVALGETVVNAAKNALFKRYAMLPFLYTLFYRSHVHGETVARALFFEYPQDKDTYAIDTQFLWGPALMIIPTLQPGADSVTAYFPKGLWYDFSGSQRKSSGENFTLNSNIEDINLAFRGGFIIPIQHAENTTTESRKQDFGLAVYPDENNRAIGELFWDDGDSIDTYEKGDYNLITFKMENVNSGKKSLSSTVVRRGYDTNMPLGFISISGVTNKPKYFKLNGKPVDFEYMNEIKVLYSYNLKSSLLTSLEMEWE